MNHTIRYECDDLAIEISGPDPVRIARVVGLEDGPVSAEKLASRREAAEADNRMDRLEAEIRDMRVTFNNRRRGDLRQMADAIDASRDCSSPGSATWESLRRVAVALRQLADRWESEVREGR